MDKILIVDDEPSITRAFSSLLSEEGHQTACAASVDEAVRIVSDEPISLVLLDLNLPRRSGLEFLKAIKTIPDEPLVLVISGQGEISVALEAVRLGAVNYLEKPVSPEKLLTTVAASLMLASSNRQRKLLVDEIEASSTILGKSRAVKKLIKTISQVAPTDATVLITGENGTGKELVATRLFLESKRRKQPFVRINCPGIPDSLFESELFGYRKGAFTGAVKDFPGKFVLADGGTIFLDEIGDLPLSCQAKLLRVLETREIEPLGDTKTTKIDVRLICATNRRLSELIEQNRFREDLYYRISVFIIEVPPLRDRRDDIPVLIGEFLRRYDASGATSLTPDAVALLTTQDYSGNVRQLKNIIERLCILHQGQRIGSGEIYPQFTVPHKTEPSSDGEETSLSHKTHLFEKQLIERTLIETKGNISQAAKLLRIDRANLSKKIKELGIKNS